MTKVAREVFDTGKGKLFMTIIMISGKPYTSHANIIYVTGNLVKIVIWKIQSIQVDSQWHSQGMAGYGRVWLMPHQSEQPNQ